MMDDLIAPAVTPIPVIAPKPRGNKGLIYLLLFISLLILVALIVLIVLFISNGSNSQTPPPSQIPTPQQAPPPPTDISDSTDQKSIEITSPSGDGTINGQVTVSGNATANLIELKVELYDNDDNLLGNAVAGLASGDSEAIHDWSVDLNILKSPATLTGRIIAYPASEDISSSLAKTQTIKFSEQTSAGRIRLFAPLSNQVTTESPVKFRGEMKDFFEGVLEVRLLTSAGTTLFQDFIMADGDNYGKFSSFSKDISFERLPLAAGDAGTWELYETSAADGTETVLLSLPVRFIE
jgi:hypothetical protein